MQLCFRLPFGGLYFLLLILTKVGTWYRIPSEHISCLCYVNILFTDFSIMRTWSLSPTPGQIHALHLKLVSCRLCLHDLGWPFIVRWLCESGWPQNFPRDSRETDPGDDHPGKSTWSRYSLTCFRELGPLSQDGALGSGLYSSRIVSSEERTLVLGQHCPKEIDCEFCMFKIFY